MNKEMRRTETSMYACRCLAVKRTESEGDSRIGAEPKRRVVVLTDEPADPGGVRLVRKDTSDARPVRALSAGPPRLGSPLRCVDVSQIFPANF